MFKNYIKVALRNLRKNRSYAFINILGLALGLMVSILVFLYVIDETSYEKHITDYQDIYRMGINANLMGQTMDAPVSCSPMAEALRTDFAEVVTAGRFKPMGQEIMLKHEDNKIYIVDVNNNPAGPPAPISEADSKTAIIRLSNAFEKTFQ